MGEEIEFHFPVYYPETGVKEWIRTVYAWEDNKMTLTLVAVKNPETKEFILSEDGRILRDMAMRDALALFTASELEGVH